ncbi:MAG TPA: serpin family protein [Steroidobacteraceae bacterium]|nr:serpin family protein [Steroidobacteraceae bacterium]
MNRKALILGFVGAALAVLCRADGTPPVEVSDAAFSFNLLRQLAQDQPATNISLSPYSAATVLEMVSNGAAGRTQEQMRQVLGTSGLSSANVNAAHKSIAGALKSASDQVVLETADAIWYRSGTKIRPEFIAVNQAFYDATVDPLDFSDPHAVDVINDWASDKTHGKIKHIADGMIDPGSARLFLADAVYFKGKWAHPFETKDTKDRPFYLRSGAEKPVPMMTQTRHFDYRDGPDYQAVRLPYAGDNLAMYVFLPTSDSSLADLVGKLTGDAWERIRVEFRSANGTVVMPKFRIEYGTQLKRPLESLGMKLAFDAGQADFSGIAPHLYISAAIQKTFVEVNEEGTEAAAVTGIAVTATALALPAPPFQMIVDRPFLFLIEDRPTQTILFAGLVYDPKP